MSVKKSVETVQESFLVHLKQTEEAITIFLVNGVKLQGVIASFDENSILLRRDGHVQLVYKHAVSTIMPVVALSGFLASLVENSSAGDF